MVLVIFPTTEKKYARYASHCCFDKNGKHMHVFSNYAKKSASTVDKSLHGTLTRDSNSALDIQWARDDHDNSNKTAKH